MQLTFEKKKNLKALGTTVGAHLLLFLFFFYFKYTMSADVVPEPMGLEVNLGTSANGSGTDQPEATGFPANLATPQQTANANSNSSKKVALNNLVTSNNQNAPSVNLSNKKDLKTNTEIRNHPQNSRQSAVAATTNLNHRVINRRPKYDYLGSTGTGQGNNAQENHPGGSEGIGTGNTDMGAPGGTPGASNYKGVPSGNGFVAALVGNRYMVAIPSPEAKYDRGGKVVIQVTVNRQGIITNYTVTSAANAKIRAIAIEKLKHVRFNRAPDASPEMFGPITFNFTTR